MIFLFLVTYETILHFYFGNTIFFFLFSQSFTLTGCNCSPSGHADNETTCFPYCSGHWEPDPHHPHLVHSQPPGQNQFHIFMMYKLFVTLTPEPIFSKLFNFFCATASFYSSSVNLCLFLAFHRKFTDPWQNQYLDSTKIIQELNTSEVLSQTETQFSIKKMGDQKVFGHGNRGVIIGVKCGNSQCQFFLSKPVIHSMLKEVASKSWYLRISKAAI